MTQDRFELKGADGRHITLDQLYDLAKDEILSELRIMDTEDALYLGNHIRDKEEKDILYENNEDNIDEQLDGWTPYELVTLDYDEYADFFYMDYGTPEFTNDVWTNLDEDEIAEAILDGEYANYLTTDIKDILTDYEEAKEFIEGLNPIRREADVLLAKYVNCEVDIGDLLQFLDRLVRNDEGWEEL